jgi:DNA processing protein
MTSLDDHTQLLALCAVEGANWRVIAREAQRPDGLRQLLAGEVIERSREATETRRRLRAALEQSFDHALERAHAELARAAAAGAQLVTVLDDGDPANLRVIFNLPPFLFYRASCNAATHARWPSWARATPRARV